MTTNKNAADTLLSMTVTEGVTVRVLPDRRHEFLMTTREVAAGYGVTEYAIRKTLLRHDDELADSKHYVTAGTFCPGAKGIPHNALLWTKRGIVRLGFFIRSERARLFRDWAEDLVLAVAEGVVAPAAVPARPARRINRLTPERVIDLLSDVCRIEDRELRERIVNKITGGLDYGTRR